MSNTFSKENYNLEREIVNTLMDELIFNYRVDPVSLLIRLTCSECGNGKLAHQTRWWVCPVLKELVLWELEHNPKLILKV